MSRPCGLSHVDVKERTGGGWLECWGQVLASDSEECRAERECHWAINSPNRKVVNSLAPTRRDSVLVSHPGAQRGLPALPLSQSGTSNKPLLSLGFCVFTYEYVMVEDILHLHYSSS